MEQKEKQIIVTIAATVLTMAVYVYVVYSKYIAADPGIINDFRFWGKSFLVLIPVAIVIQIVIHILFAILNAIVTREELPTKDDERDKLIELKSIRVSHWIFTAGFLLSMGSLAIGMQPWVMFVTLISSGFLSGIISEIVKIFYYRRGV